MCEILVVFTGGTIGSSSHEQNISPQEGKSYMLIEAYNKSHPQEAVNFTIIEPLTLLSEDLTPKDWEHLIKAIEAADFTKYQGVIITHGTDTLALSSALLSLYFHAIDLPMLLVSSHLPLDDHKANGGDNFNAAVAFIQNKIAKGVFVPYKNPNEKAVTLFYGTRIAMSPQLSSDFHAVGTAFGYFNEGAFSHLAKRTKTKASYRLSPRFAENLLYIKPYVGMNYANFNLKEVTCVLHDLYHSGTTASRPLLDFLQRCEEKKIPLYLAPLFKQEAYYASSHSLQASKAHYLYTISIESALAKLYLAYGNFQDPKALETFLQTPLHYEFLN